MTPFAEPEITPLGATALLARFGDRIDRDLTLRITRLVDLLAGGPGIVDLVPAYTTLVAIVDPEEATSLGAVRGRIEGLWRSLRYDPNTDSLNSDVIDIPIAYGGEAGPDLAEVAEATALSPAEVIRRHSGAEYTVGALGFSPGFAFLIGLPPELAVPRRSSPRVRVPAGSVGIGGAQTGIYSLPTPGGWNLIGRTTRVMFDPAREGEHELRPGDRIRFVPIEGEGAVFPEPMLAAESATSNGSIEIVEPGAQSSVQDLGRPGQGGAGIPPGGALDRSALVAGNRLLGNPDGAAAIEWTLLPPTLRFHLACRTVLTGADPGWRRSGEPIAIGEVIELAPGDELRGQPDGGTPGARGYVCVAGGIDVPVVRGSRSLDLSAGFGGGFGRPFRAGDRLGTGDGSDNPNTQYIGAHDNPVDPASAPFRVVRGPQADRFGAAAWETFLSAPFTVDAQSNRMGLRLNGPAIVPEGGADVISEGVVTGAIQVTGSGQPIVLLPGRATIGGYTKIATVIEADHDRLGQLRPGATIRFHEVSMEEAEAALRAWRPSVYGGLRSNKEPDVTDDRPSLTSPNAWTPDGVIRVIRELAAHDVEAFSLRVKSAGLEIVIDRGGGLPGRPGRVWRHRSSAPVGRAGIDESADPPKTEAFPTITAPLLGTFWRRPTPDAPHFVDEGDTIEAGQTVGLIEVMKSFHEVTATHPGIVRRFLVDEGDTVEYGQPLVELESPREG